MKLKRLAGGLKKLSLVILMMSTMNCSKNWIIKTCDWAEPELVTTEDFKKLSDDSKRNIINYQTNYNQ